MVYLLKPRGEKDTFIISRVHGFVTPNQNLYREINFAGGSRKGKSRALASPVPRPAPNSRGRIGNGGTGSPDHFILSAVPISSSLFPLDLPFSGALSVIAEQRAGLLNQVLVPGPEHDYCIFFLRVVPVLLPQPRLQRLVSLVFFCEPDLHQLAVIMGIDLQMRVPVLSPFGFGSIFLVLRASYAQERYPSFRRKDGELVKRGVVGLSMIGTSLFCKLTGERPESSLHATFPTAITLNDGSLKRLPLCRDTCTVMSPEVAVRFRS